MSNIARPDWDTYFLDMARVACTRSACFRHKVGAIIVKNKVVISTGYNGAPQYQPNCQEVGYCYRERHHIQSGTNLEKCRAVGSHAESNAIALAAKSGHSTEGSTMYIVGHYFICDQCKAQIANSGIILVIIEDLNGKRMIFVPENDWKKHTVDNPL